MFEVLSELETKIQIIQIYGKCMLKLYDLFGNETIIILFFTMVSMSYIGIFMGFLFLDLPTRPFLEHITYTDPLFIKREYTILTYFFGINYFRDIIDDLIRQVIIICFGICIKILSDKRVWNLAFWLRKYLTHWVQVITNVFTATPSRFFYVPIISPMKLKK